MTRYCLLTVALFTLLASVVPGSAQDIGEAAGEGDLATVKMLVKKTPELVNVKDETGRTPLHWACRGVHMEVLQYLIENGADVNARDENSVTPLHSLSYRGESQAMELLIRKGADVEATDDGGLVPLLYAAYGGHEVAAAILIKNGAKVNARDNTGLTAVDLAEDQGHVKLARYLIANGGELTPVADPEVTELADDVHKITFCYQQCTNMLLLTGPEGVLLIDTGYRRTADKLKTAIDNISKGKKILIINTHPHQDHTGGNAIAGDEKDIISSTNLEHMVSRGILEKGKGPLKGASGTKYGGYFSMHFNDQEIRLIPLPGTHTDDDMIVLLVDSGIVHMGDLLISQSFPSLTRGAKVVGYMDILDKVVDVFDDETIFVGGHGRDLTKELFVEYRDILRETIEIVTKGMKAGKSAKQMQQDGILEDYAAYNTFISELSTEYWIEAVCKSFAGRI
jgi:glyoxylase-like metal-dependent hydrolase (beta-lactamase superfamily II)